MTKFEEEAIKEAEKSKFIMNSYDGEFTASDIGLNIKLGRVAYNFPWLEFAKNWHSEEEFQELFDKYSNLNDHYEKEVIRSSKLESQIIGLKSQLQQQALPVVPECVDLFIKECREFNYDLDQAFYEQEDGSEATENNKCILWRRNHPDEFARAWLDGYTVEKPQLFYLKNKLTGKYLRKSKHTKDDWNEDIDRVETVNNKTKFTQQEIDSMQIGSYEQIEVEE